MTARLRSANGESFEFGVSLLCFFFSWYTFRPDPNFSVVALWAGSVAVMAAFSIKTNDLLRYGGVHGQAMRAFASGACR